MPNRLEDFFRTYKNHSGAPWNASLREGGKDRLELLQLFYNDMMGAQRGAPPLRSEKGYIDWLSKRHGALSPNVYLEIGINTGGSLKLAAECEIAIGVDPAPHLNDPAFNRPPFRIVEDVSDEFFLRSSEFLGGKKINLAFIDGLHVFEFALRDFIGCEALSEPNSVVAIHDVLPRTPAHAARNRFTNGWTGDVWRTVLTLKHFRPDLHIEVLPQPPTGLAVVTKLDPGNTLLREKYLEAVQYGLSISCADFFDGRERQAPAPRAAASALPGRFNPVREPKDYLRGL